MPKAPMPEGRVVTECQVIERDDGRWVLCVYGRPTMVLAKGLRHETPRRDRAASRPTNTR